MNTDRFRLLHLRRVRNNPLRSAVSVVGIASGVALVVAVASLLTSVGATADATVTLLGGARYEITVPAEDVDRASTDIAGLDDVDGVRRFIEAPIMIDDTQAWLVALDDRDGELGTSEAQLLAATDGIRTGSALSSTGVHLFAGLTGVQTSAEVAGPVDPALEDRYGGKLVVADLDSALALQGRTGNETLLVYGDPDPLALAAAAGDADIRDTANRVVQARNSLELMFVPLSILGAMGLVVGGFLLFNTMNMAVLERRHEIASLRALGSDRKSILTGVLTEAALLGAVGSAVGLVFGAALANSVVKTVPDAFTRAIGTPLQTSVPATLLAAAWLVGIATAVVSAIAPARRALRVEPLEALRPDVGDVSDRGVTRRVWLVGLGVVLTVLPLGQFAMAAAMVGLLCIAAGAAPLITGLTIAVAKRMGSSGELAATALRRSPRRVWGTTTVVLVAVAIAVTTAGMSNNITRTTNANLASVRTTDFWVGTTTGDTIGLTGLPAAWRSEFEAIPGVASVGAGTWLPAESGDHLVGIHGNSGHSGYPFTQLADDEAQELMAAGEGAIVLKQTALAFDVGVGDTMELPGAVPPLELPIVAVTGAISPASGGLITISHDLLAAHYGVDSFSRYEVVLEPDADPAIVRRQLDEITEAGGPAIQIHTGEEFLQQLEQTTDDVVALISLVVLVIIVCAGIAVLNTLLASTLERTSEIAALRAIGATKRRILTSIAAEALAVGLTGAALGAIAGSVNHALIVGTFRDATAFDIDYAFRPSTVATAMIIGIAIAAVGAAVPCRRATRLDILDALAR
jgi:putative ABC transport system permease protein